MNKTFYFTLIMALLLTACGSRPETIIREQPADQFDPSSQELGLSTQLTLGVLRLEETDHAITSEQAADMLPLWQVFKSLSTSDNAAQEEMDAILEQIKETMTSEQLAAIEDMTLTREDIATVVQDLGLPQLNREGQPPEDSEGRQRPNGGFPGGGPGGNGSFGGQEITPEQIATAQARRAENGGGFGNRLITPLIEAVIDLLEAKTQ